MTILIDTREQDTPRLRKRIHDMGTGWERRALDYGDYTFNALLPSGEPIFPDGEQKISPLCAIERKMNLDELATCFTSSRDRFEAEFRRAADHGARLWLLIEDSSWSDLLAGKYRSLASVNSMAGSLLAIQTRFDVRVVFCQTSDTGQTIARILRWELKERLERGDFDAWVYQTISPAIG